MVPLGASMRVIFLVLFIIATGVQGPAQESAPTPARVCIAQLRNQTANKFDVVKLRQLLMDGMTQTKLGKAGSIAVVPMEVSESEDAQAAVQSLSCQFAVYTRLLQQAPVEPSNVDVSGGITYRSAQVQHTQFVMGVQCTVERKDSSIPALIDRQYSKSPVPPQVGIEKLLAAEAQRIADAVEKKLSSTPK
jgi:hypothetical protein